MERGLRFCGGVLAFALLSACEGGVLASLPSVSGGASQVEQAPAFAQLELLDGAVTAAGPDGYCADLSASAPDDGFAIFAPCTSLDPEAEARALAGLATVQVGASDSATVTGQEAAFVALLESPEGAAVLSRTGQADTVTIQSTKPDEGAVSVRFTDSAPTDFDGAQALQWRAFVDVGNRLVTISVRGLQDAPLARAEGSAMLRQAIAALVAANDPEGATDS